MFSTETSVKIEPHDNIQNNDEYTADKTKTLVFIRHGQSEWNHVFNNEGGFSILRMVKMILMEAVLLMSSKSIFIDSPLTFRGIDEARYLQFCITAKRKCKQLDDDEYSKLLSGGLEGDINTLSDDQELINEELNYKAKYFRILKGSEKSRIITSDLRRAITTTSIALYDRLKKEVQPRIRTEKMLLLPFLREASRNVDAFCITPMNSLPDHSLLAYNMESIKEKFPEVAYIERLETLETKALQNDQDRMNNFIDFIFNSEFDNFIVGGHSHYFREFFKRYLPSQSEHEGKKSKMANAAAVGLEIVKYSNTAKPVYQINEESIQCVHLCFIKGNLKKHRLAFDTFVFTMFVAVAISRIIYKGISQFF